MDSTDQIFSYKLIFFTLIWPPGHQYGTGSIKLEANQTSMWTDVWSSIHPHCRPGWTRPAEGSWCQGGAEVVDFLLLQLFFIQVQRQIHKYKDKSNSNTTNYKHFKEQLDQLSAKRGAKVLDFHLNSTLSQILSVGLSLPLPLSFRIKGVIASFCVFWKF